MANRRSQYAGRLRRKRRQKLLTVLAVLALLLTVSGTLARYVRETEPLKGSIQKVQVSCAVEEAYSGNVKSKIAVKNTSSADVYLRLRLVTYWKAPSGDVAAKDSEPIPDFEIADGWIKDGINNTYYYKYPVPKNAATPNLLKTGNTITLKSADGYTQVIEVLAEAIQAMPKKAAEEAWGTAIAAQLADAYAPVP